MVSKESRQNVRVKKHDRMRNRFKGGISGTAERPRLAVFRSNNHMYAQIIDDTVGKTLISASTLEKSVSGTVVFDRGGFLYAGKIAALAEAAREAGLEF